MARGGKNARISAIVLGRGATNCTLCAMATKAYDPLDKLGCLFCIGPLMRSVRVSLGVSSGPIIRAIPATKLHSNDVVKSLLIACLDIDACVSNLRRAAVR
jgi:hypothetical protein